MEHTIDFLYQRISSLEALIKLKDKHIERLEAQLDRTRTTNPKKENYGR